MSSYFARALNKAPTYLAPRRRPTLPRTLSNSSEISISSNRSDDLATEAALSAPGTPTLEEQPRSQPDSPGLNVSRAGRSRPVAIEIPQIQKKGTSSIYTPTEPLSGRGDQPGAYFPLHEDPELRVRHPHPFTHETQSFTGRSSSAMNPELPMTQRRATSPGLSMANKGATVSSYIPAGFHDQPLPLGKYYPSNYENSSESLRSRGCSYSSDKAPFAHPDSHTSSYMPSRSDSKKRLEQYQRDMIAQASMALDSYKSTSPAMQSIPDIRIGGVTPRKPMSPRLDPLGSPGPVTPMELETAANYIDKSKPPMPFAKTNVKPSNLRISPGSH